MIRLQKCATTILLRANHMLHRFSLTTSVGEEFLLDVIRSEIQQISETITTVNHAAPECQKRADSVMRAIGG